MSDEKLYMGRGTPEMFDDYMDFINYVFGFNGNQSDFKKLLPKLYKYEYEPAVSSYVVTEDGKLKSAIGAFDHDIVVCGRTLKTRGIGNVAVHPYSRSKGYMKKLMEMAMDDMVKDGVVLSVLGGRRQRYRYFSFEKLGQRVSFSVNSDNIRHTFGKDFTPLFRFKKLSAADTGVLDEIRELSESMPLYAARAGGKRYYEVLITWFQCVRAAFIDGKFAAYVIEKEGEISELLIRPEYMSHLRELVRDLYREIGRSTMYIKLPVYLNDYIKAIQDIPEGISIESPKQFSVLNYKAVCEAFMELKATYAHLPDGELVLDIDGRGGHERLLFSVKNGVPSVADTDCPADLTLGHIAAENLLFAPVCAEREQLPDFARLWLPLPLFIYYSDAV